MKKFNLIIIVVVTVLFFTGCTSKRLDRIESKLYYLERSISKMERALIKNDQSIKTELKQLYKETEYEIKRIRSKTDKFKVRQSSGTLLFEPTSR
jgi:hypothetical protein